MTLPRRSLRWIKFLWTRSPRQQTAPCARAVARVRPGRFHPAPPSYRACKDSMPGWSSRHLRTRRLPPVTVSTQLSLLSASRHTRKDSDTTRRRRCHPVSSPARRIGSDGQASDRRRRGRPFTWARGAQRAKRCRADHGLPGSHRDGSSGRRCYFRAGQLEWGIGGHLANRCPNACTN
jgi:hypothetical protein